MNIVCGTDPGPSRHGSCRRIAPLFASRCQPAAQQGMSQQQSREEPPCAPLPPASSSAATGAVTGAGSELLTEGYSIRFTDNNSDGASMSAKLHGPSQWGGNYRSLGRVEGANAAATPWCAINLESNVKQIAKHFLQFSHRSFPGGAKSSFEVDRSLLAKVESSLCKLSSLKANHSVNGFVDVILIQTKQVVWYWASHPGLADLVPTFLESMQIAECIPCLGFGCRLMEDPKKELQNGDKKNTGRVCTMATSSVLSKLRETGLTVIFHVVTRPNVGNKGEDGGINNNPARLLAQKEQELLDEIDKAAQYGDGWSGFNVDDNSIFLDRRHEGQGEDAQAANQVNPHLTNAYMQASTMDTDVDIHIGVPSLLRAMFDFGVYSNLQDQCKVLACLNSLHPGLLHALRESSRHKNSLGLPTRPEKPLALAICKLLGLPATLSGGPTARPPPGSMGDLAATITPTSRWMTDVGGHFLGLGTKTVPSTRVLHARPPTTHHPPPTTHHPPPTTHHPPPTTHHPPPTTHHPPTLRSPPLAMTLKIILSRRWKLFTSRT